MVKCKIATAIELVKILYRKRKAEQEFISNQFTLMEENIKRHYLRQIEFETEVAMGTALSTITLVKGNRSKRVVPISHKAATGGPTGI